ncbi:MAG: glucokinase [Terriglobia bacterium]
MILAGDIGGTKSRLAFFSPEGEPSHPLSERSLSSRDYPSLAAVVKEFLRESPEQIQLACFGVPGPVVEGLCETPNLPWVVNARQLRRIVGGEVILLNDLEATAYGIATLAEEEFFPLSQGKPNPQGNAALIAPGTGLGEAILFWDGRQHRPSASEGGHTDFAPRTALEMDFLRHSQKCFDHMSYDRVLSGSGLQLIYSFLKQADYAEEPAWLREEMAGAEDPAAVISGCAMDGRSALCTQALTLWVSIFGAEAGNLALTALATAGVYLGGGIAPKILPKLKDGTFLTAFTDKGRLSAVVGQMPVRVILKDKAALFGAARFALDRHCKM